jgi:uncharacterized protein (DUF427 family)
VQQIKMMENSPNAVNIPTNVGIATESSEINAAANNSNLASTSHKQLLPLEMGANNYCA